MSVFGETDASGLQGPPIGRRLDGRALLKPSAALSPQQTSEPLPTALERTSAFELRRNALERPQWARSGRSAARGGTSANPPATPGAALANVRLTGARLKGRDSFSSSASTASSPSGTPTVERSRFNGFASPPWISKIPSWARAGIHRELGGICGDPRNDEPYSSRRSSSATRRRISSTHIAISS